jgi:hypothetical protein
VAQVLAIAREQYGIDLTLGRVPVTVDMDGLGVGVGDQLRQKNVWVIDFKGNATSQVDPRTYVNLRAEAYATLGRRLNPDDRCHGIPWAIPASESLRQELCAPEKIYGTDGLRFGLTPKTRGPDREDIVTVKEKLGRSPDEADSVVYLWHAVRILFNLNELFQQVSAPLVMYPQPGDSSRELPGNGHAAAKENENLAWLRQQYGSLIGASPAPPDHVQEKIDRFKKESDKKAREAAEAAAKANGNGNGNGHAGKPAESWLDHVQWGDEK